MYLLTSFIRKSGIIYKNLSDDLISVDRNVRCEEGATEKKTTLKIRKPFSINQDKADKQLADSSNDEILNMLNNINFAKEDSSENNNDESNASDNVESGFNNENRARNNANYGNENNRNNHHLNKRNRNHHRNEEGENANEKNNEYFDSKEILKCNQVRVRNTEVNYIL